MLSTKESVAFFFGQNLRTLLIWATKPTFDKITFFCMFCLATSDSLAPHFETGAFHVPPHNFNGFLFLPNCISMASKVVRSSHAISMMRSMVALSKLLISITSYKLLLCWSFAKFRCIKVAQNLKRVRLATLRAVAQGCLSWNHWADWQHPVLYRLYNGVPLEQ